MLTNADPMGSPLLNPCQIPAWQCRHCQCRFHSNPWGTFGCWGSPWRISMEEGDAQSTGPGNGLESGMGSHQCHPLLAWSPSSLTQMTTPFHPLLPCSVLPTCSTPFLPTSSPLPEAYGGCCGEERWACGVAAALECSSVKRPCVFQTPCPPLHLGHNPQQPRTGEADGPVQYPRAAPL